MAVWNYETEGEAETIGNITKESDRSAAIIAAIFLENRLERELKRRLRNDDAAKSAIDQLFHISGPLGAFASKIRLGFTMRLYGKQVFREMTTIKDIRNEFAHIIGENAPRSFKEQHIRDWCFNLKIVENYHRPLSEMPPLFSTIANPPSADEARLQSGMSYSDNPSPDLTLKDPRQRYLETCSLFAARFDGSGKFLIIGDEPGPWR